MTIRFQLDPERADLVGFGISPLAEAVLSLHVLLFPKSHAAQHPWIRAMRRLSPELKRELRAFAFVYFDALPDCLLPPQPDVDESFAEQVARLEELDPSQLAYELARPAFHYTGPSAPDARALADPTVQERIRAVARRNGPECVPTAELLLGDPAAFRVRFLALVRRYWEEAFAEEWSRLEPLLRRALEQDEALVAATGPYALLERLQPELRVDRAAGRFTRRSPHEHEVTVTAEDRLLLMPSVYIWPHTRANCDGPWPLTVVYPASFVAIEARLAPVPDELVRAFRAAGDPTRLRALRLIAERPRTTEELAPLVGLSESGLSKHLKALVDGGLVETRRDGWYVLYEVRRDRLDTLSAELGAFVDGL